MFSNRLSATALSTLRWRLRAFDFSSRSAGLSQHCKLLRTRSTLRYSSQKVAKHSTSNVDVVQIPVGMAGKATMSLHNMVDVAPRDPVLIYIPPIGNTTPKNIIIPDYLTPYPLAVMHYRWSHKPTKKPYWPTSLMWPMPMYDVSLCYEELKARLDPKCPEDPGRRRDLYVYGEDLGASIAVSLALVNCRAVDNIAIRGIAAYDGIYDWTRFLPDHYDNLCFQSGTDRNLHTRHSRSRGWKIDYWHRKVPSLFKNPEKMFDPFVSPCFHFKTPAIRVPVTFNRDFWGEYEDHWVPKQMSEEDEWELLAEAYKNNMVKTKNGEYWGEIRESDKRFDLHPDRDHRSHLLRRLEATAPGKPPVYLQFPPVNSHLVIPESLLLYSHVSMDYESFKSVKISSQKRLTTADVDLRDVVHGPITEAMASGIDDLKVYAKPNTFKTQAEELAYSMVRSVYKMEKEKWNVEKWAVDERERNEIMQNFGRRVGIADVGRSVWGGEKGERETLPEKGKGILRTWLKVKLGERVRYNENELEDVEYIDEDLVVLDCEDPPELEDLSDGEAVAWKKWVDERTWLAGLREVRRVMEMNRRDAAPWGRNYEAEEVPEKIFQGGLNRYMRGLC